MAPIAESRARDRGDRGRQWEAALEDVLRGIGGGLVFGMPLLYTMEMWSLGHTAEPSAALLRLLLTFVPVFLLVASSGFRKTLDLTRLDVVVDVVTVVGLGLLAAAVVLVTLQRITLSTPLPTALQMVVFEAAPFAVGAAVASEVFNRAGDEPQSRREEPSGPNGPDDADEGARGRAWDLGATAVGATFIALSVAPTDEVPMLAAGIAPRWLVVLVGASLLVTYAIVFAAGFSDEERRRAQTGVLQRPLTETGVAYLVSLAISAALLWFFGNPDATTPGVALTHAVVLSFPASIGGAAGRLVV